ncbi:S8 family serine peptidase [Aestuariivivens insulae]|uniref:S8 family serine peptidase n=1 Tax=Aestuariivivens insulae TaxID=1621988 RepID=UPI001F56349C|nr:S8 family serine peptidase [Aestuariivivens insulae]
MKKGLLFIGILCFQLNILAQQDAWVYLTDKENVTASIANPITILTQKAIDRKAAHNVTIDDRDVPVNENYITQLKNTTGITVMAKSKWFNAVHVRGSQTDIQNLENLVFVNYIDFADKSLNTSKTSKKAKVSKLNETFTIFNYGSAANQIEMFKGDKLHVAGYSGTGMTVAVLDAGFPNVNVVGAFKRLRDAGNLLGAYDFVNRDNDVYTGTTSSHGTWVLSDMAGYIEIQFVGTAPDASYYLFITEDALSENPVEESYWVEAAERADSLGVDVINTSLGYTTYDNPNYSYTTADMDGNTTYITRGANIAFEKGMLLVNSAGNSGNNSWGIVGAPADAAGVFSVGAVDANGNYAAFSSKGSALQPTQKPDVVAQGQASYVVSENNIIGTADGTSFSSPIMAGGMVCLWQALPDMTNAEIMQLVRESASQYSSPDYYLGYGIPNLEVALNTALEEIQNANEPIELFIYPNPTKTTLFVKAELDHFPIAISLFDILGKQVLQSMLLDLYDALDVSTLSNGVYVARIHLGGTSKTFKLIKRDND